MIFFDDSKSGCRGIFPLQHESNPPLLSFPRTRESRECRAARGRRESAGYDGGIFERSEWEALRA